MRKFSIVLAICVLMMAVMPLTAFAHGHRRGGNGSGYVNNQQYSLCDVQGCNTATMHYHGNNYYYGHYYGDGHNYHNSGYHGGYYHH